MKINVRLFASLREQVGTGSLEREVAEGTTAGDLWLALQREFPGLANSGRISLAVNSEYRDENHTLGDGDELALIPPVSGG